MLGKKRAGRRSHLASRIAEKESFRSIPMADENWRSIHFDLLDPDSKDSIGSLVIGPESCDRLGIWLGFAVRIGHCEYVRWSAYSEFSQLSEFGDQYQRFMYADDADLTLHDTDCSLRLSFTPDVRSSTACVSLDITPWLHAGAPCLQTKLREIRIPIEQLRLFGQAVRDWLATGRV